MRIVHVADSFAPDIGGIERQVETLVRLQVAQGHDVTVITAVAESADLDRELDVVRAAKGRWLTVAFPWRNRRRVAAVLDGRPIDVLHVHLTVVSPVAIYVARKASRRGIAVATTVHSIWWKFALAHRASNLPFGWGPIRAAWSAVSSVAAGHVRRVLRTVTEVSVVPNLVETDWWQADMPRQRETSDTIRLVLVGRLKKRKHVDEFLDVLAEVRRRVPTGAKVSVSIVGDGPRRADLQRQVDDLGLADWVALLGHRDAAAVRDLHHHSDLFVASSRQESFGIAALEARSAGLPVIGYRRNGLVDFVADGVDGVLVADQPEMVQALVDLIGRPGYLRRLLDNTTSTPPSITPAAAAAAVAELYERARSVPSGTGRRTAPRPSSAHGTVR